MVRRVFAALLLAALCAAMLALPQMLRGGLLFPGAQRYLFYAGGASSQARMVPASAAEAPLVRANYYYSAPALGGGVWLEGQPVNLHVAVRGQGACIGSPLIFGGY